MIRDQGICSETAHEWGVASCDAAPHSTKAVVWLRRGIARALLVAKMETGRFYKRTTRVEYVTVASTIALLSTVYFFGGYGTNSQLAAPKASCRDARSEYAGPRDW
jgi:hypothetical protein